MSGPEVVTVPLGERSYEVVVGSGVLAEVGDRAAALAGVAACAVVTQAPVRRYADAVSRSLSSAGLEVAVIEVEDGETAKRPEVLADLWGRLAELALTRSDLVVAVGGGVVGDLAGFAAASYNRGIRVLQVPTTLLAQVDAAVGGKTGVNLPAGKNLVGAFHQPVAVVADVDVLATLPSRVRTEGLGEVVKYGLIRDPAILDLLEARTAEARAGDPELLGHLVRRSVAVKGEVVAADELESGQRVHLNLGHTFGHAVESLTGYDVLHGEAVAIGTVVALRLGRALGITPAPLVARVTALLGDLGLPGRAPRLDRDAVWEAMRRDKKADGGVRFVVVGDPGDVRVVRPDRDVVDDAIDETEQEADGG